MRSLKTFVVVVPLLSGLILTSQLQADTWTDKSGKHRIEAKFLSASGGNIYLEKSDGTKIAVPIDKLSPESLEQAKRLYKAAMAAGGGTEAAPTIPSAPTASSGQSKLPANPTAQQTAEILTAAMAEFDMVTIWDALPSKHQGDVEEVVQLAANSIDAGTWNSVTGLLKNITKIVTDKKEFFLNNPMIAASLPKSPETNQMWDATAEMLAAYANSSIMDQNAMKKFTMMNFIKNDVPKMRASFQKVQTLTANMQEGSPFGQMSELPKFELVSETATEATFRITQAGQTEEETFVKVDNRWVPIEMAQGWDEGIAKAKEGLASLSTPEGQQGLMQMKMGLTMVTPFVDQMLNANTQADFDNVVNSIAGMAMGMMGGLGGPGGPGGPPGFGPPGGPGGPGAFPPGGFGDGPPPGFGDGGEDVDDIFGN